MRNKDGKSKLHSGRPDRDRGASRRRRKDEEQVDWTAPPTAQIDWCEEETFQRALDRHFAARAQAEARDQSLDGLHSDEAP